MDSLKVAVRLRPLLPKENKSLKPRWHINEQTISLDGPESDMTFSFDHIFDETATNELVYQELASDIVKKAMEGYNGTVFCYGQSGSGKTFTTDELRRLALREILEYIENCPQREFLLRVSYFEIYNEKVTDLLQDNRELTLREDVDKNVLLDGMHEAFVKTSNQVLELLNQGNERRRISETKMNARSSRSHCIFRIVVESRMRGSEENIDISGVLVANLYLVDLAGSEKASANTGDRFREGVLINKSLLTLSLVIRQLAEDSNQHISYRDSKLTRILQNALGGNSKTAILCTVSPGNVEETLSTLRFGQSAKRVLNKPLLNEVVTDKALLKRHQKEIETLKATITKLESEHSQQSKLKMEALRLEQKNMLEMFSSRLCVSSNVTERSFKTRRQTVCITQISRRQDALGLKVSRFSPIKLPVPEIEEDEPLPAGPFSFSPEKIIDHPIDSPCSKPDCMCLNLSFKDFERELITDHAVQEYKRLIDLLVKENSSLKLQLSSSSDPSQAISPHCDATDLFPGAINWDLSKNVSTVWELSEQNDPKEMDSDGQKAQPEAEMKAETGTDSHLLKEIENCKREIEALKEMANKDRSVILKLEEELHKSKVLGQELDDEVQFRYTEIDDLTEKNRELQNLIETGRIMLSKKDEEISEAIARAQAAEEMFTNIQKGKAELEAKLPSQIDISSYHKTEAEKDKLEIEGLQEMEHKDQSALLKVIDLLKEEVSSSKEKEIELNEELQLRYGEIDDLTEENQDFRNMVETGKTMLVQKSKEIIEANTRAQEAEVICKTLQEQNAQLEAEVSYQLDTARDINMRHEKLKVEQEELKVEHENLKVEHENLKMKHEDLKVEQEELKVEHENLKVEHEELKVEHENLKVEHENLKVEHEDLKVEQEELKVEHENLTVEHENLKVEHEDLKVEQEELKVEHENLKVEHENLKVEHENLKVEHENLKVEHENLKVEHERFKKEDNSLQDMEFTDRSGLLMEIDRLKDEVSSSKGMETELNEELQLRYAKIVDLTEQNQDIRNIVETGQTMLVQKSQEIIEANMRAQEAEVICKTLQEQNAQLEAEVSYQLDTARDINMRHEKLKVEQEELKVEHENLKVEHENLKMKHEDLKVEQEELKVEHENLKVEHEELKVEHENLKVEHENLKVEHEDLKVEQEELKVEHENLTVEHENLKVEHEDLKVEQEELKVEHENLKVEHENLKVEHENLKVEHENLKVEHENLKVEHERFKKEDNSLQDMEFTDRSGLLMEIDRLKDEVSSSKGMETELNEELQLRYAKIVDLTEQNQDIRNIVETGQTMLVQKSQEIIEANMRAQEAEVICKTLQEQNAQLEAEVSYQLDTARDINMRHEKLKVEHEELKVEHEELKVELEELKVEHENLKVEHERFKKEDNSLQDMEFTDRSGLLMEIDRLKDEVSSSKGMETELNEELQLRYAEIDDLTEENEGFRNMIEIGKTMLAKKTEEITEANTRAQETEEKCKTLKSQNVQLETQLCQVRQLEIDNNNLRKEVSKLKDEFSKEKDYYNDIIKKLQMALREKGSEATIVQPQINEMTLESMRTRFMFENAEKFVELEELRKKTKEQAETITKLKELCNQQRDKENTQGAGKQDKVELDTSRVRPLGVPALKERQITSNIVVPPTEQEKRLQEENLKLQATEQKRNQKVQVEAELGQVRCLEIENNNLRKEIEKSKDEFSKEKNYYNDIIKKLQMALREKGSEETFVQPKINEITLESLKTRFMFENAEKFVELEELRKKTKEQADTITKLKELCNQQSDKENTQGAGKQDKVELDTNRVRPLGVPALKERQITSNIVVPPTEQEKRLQEENIKLKKELQKLQTESQQAQMGFSGGTAEILMVRQYERQVERLNRKIVEQKDQLRNLQEQLNIQKQSR